MKFYGNSEDLSITLLQKINKIKVTNEEILEEHMNEDMNRSDNIKKETSIKKNKLYLCAC